MDWDFGDIENNRLPNLPVSAGSPIFRFIARSIDFLFYGTLLICFQLLVMNRNVFSRIPQGTIIFQYQSTDTWTTIHRAYVFIFNHHMLLWTFLLILCVLMLVFEPVFLRLFGTTPGKALVGIRVLDINGNKPKIWDGIFRTLRVFALGFGLFFPIYSLFRLYKSYDQCRNDGEMLWDDELHLNNIIVDYNPIRPLLMIPLSILLPVLFIIPSFHVAQTPRHRGGLTPSELRENIERFMRFHHSDASAVWLMEPELNIVEFNGIVHEISFEVENADAWGIRLWMQAYIIAMVGGQPGASTWNMFIRPGWRLDSLMRTVETIGYRQFGGSAQINNIHGINVYIEIATTSAQSLDLSRIDMSFIMRMRTNADH